MRQERVAAAARRAPLAHGGAERLGGAQLVGRREALELGARCRASRRTAYWAAAAASIADGEHLQRRRRHGGRAFMTLAVMLLPLSASVRSFGRSLIAAMTASAERYDLVPQLVGG